MQAADRLAGDEQQRELELLGRRRRPRARRLVVGDVEHLERDLLRRQQLLDLLLGAMILAVEVEHHRRRLAARRRARRCRAAGAPLVELGSASRTGRPARSFAVPSTSRKQLDRAKAVAALGGEHVVHGGSQLIGHAVKHAPQYRAAVRASRRRRQRSLRGMALRLLFFKHMRDTGHREASALHPMSTIFPSALLSLTPLLDIVRLVTRNPVWARVAFWSAFVGVLVVAVAVIPEVVDWLATDRHTRARRAGAAPLTMHLAALAPLALGVFERLHLAAVTRAAAAAGAAVDRRGSTPGRWRSPSPARSPGSSAVGWRRSASKSACATSRPACPSRPDRATRRAA